MSIIADSSFVFASWLLDVVVAAGWENVSASDSAFATLDRRLCPADPRVEDRLRCLEGEGEAPVFVGDCEITAAGGGNCKCNAEDGAA